MFSDQSASGLPVRKASAACFEKKKQKVFASSLSQAFRRIPIKLNRCRCWAAQVFGSFFLKKDWLLVMLRPQRELLVGFLVAGCTVGPDYHPPSPSSPPAFGREEGGVPSITASGAIDKSWWRSFNDPELTSLVGRIATQNLDLQEAAERVLQGRAQARIAASEGLPGINYNAAYRRERLSTKGPFGPDIFEIRPGAPIEIDDWRQGPSASWDLDLFGRVRRAVESQKANTEAAYEARNALALAMAADLATDYLQLRGVQARTDVTARDLALAEQNVGLLENRFRNGVATTLEVAQAKAQRATIAQTLPPLRQQEAELINAIGYLLGEHPRALAGELSAHMAQPGVPPTVPVGLPGDMIRRRPDVREAEARLHAATAQTGVAVASFYPDIRLTGDFSLEGLTFANAWDLEARAFSLGPTVSLPLFEGGRLTGTLNLRKSQQREAGIAFKKTVLQAWQEADNALTAYNQAQRARRETAEAVTQNQVALGAARQRYGEGASDYLNVVSAEASLLQSQNALAESDAQIGTDLVRIYRALGGGWENILVGAASNPKKV